MAVEIRNLTIAGTIRDSGRSRDAPSREEYVTTKELELVCREMQAEFKRLIRQSVRKNRER